ncbi:proline-rich protein 19 [Mixophyes fleayi]|uniref:proline-rich protein 19 n=1 Tax=Mixophyes fleayi TaxID=3061075 RepID=UPI003F4D89CF
MDQGSSCLQCLKTQALTSSSAGSESRVFSFRGNQGKVRESSTSRAAKVKRWKTKKERNSVKYKSHKETFQKKAYPKGFLQLCHMNSCSSGSKTVPQPAGNLKQVFITHNRLTQHHGIFNREVKSVDIGRLVNQTTEMEAAKTDIGNVTTQSDGKKTQSPVNLSLNLIPTPEIKAQEALPSPSHRAPEILVQASKAVSDTQQDEEEENPELRLQSDSSHLPITLPGSGPRTSPCKKQVAPVLEAAEDILNMLSSRSLFPGRNLVSETRQSIVEKVKQLCGTHSNPSPVSVGRKPDYSYKAAHQYKDPGWEHVSDGDTDVRKSVQRPRSAGRQMPTSSIRFLPLSKDSPVHTLIKMVSPEDQQKITDDFRQPTTYGSGNKLFCQYKRVVAENSQNICNITSSSNPKLSRRDRNMSSFCRARRPGNVHNPSLGEDSPQVRWKFPHDDLSYTHNDHQHNRSPHLSGQDSRPRQPLQDISSNQRNKTGLSAKGNSSGERQTSFDVLCSIWSCSAQKSPTAQIFDVSPTETRLCYMELSPHRTHPTSNLESHRNVFPEVLEDITLAVPDNSTSEESWCFRNPKKHMSSHLAAGTGLHHGMFPTKSMPTWRNFHESRYGELWSPPSLREGPMHKVSMENGRGTEWNSREAWSLGTSHLEQINQRRKISILSPYSQSLEQENSFTSLPYERSLRKVLLDRSSSDPWVYPRMKLY